MQITRLTSSAEVLLATGHDAYARGTLRRPDTRGWMGAGATAWIGVDPHDLTPDLCALGDPGPVGELIGELLPELSPRQGLTAPRGTVARLPAWVGMAGTDWDFRWTATPPPEQPGEERVRVVTDLDAVADLLAASSPTASAAPGDADVVRWLGTWEGDRLVACGADTSGVPGVGHLKSIAVHPDGRRQGLGAAVTAALTRALLAEGCEVVTLGMYADNAGGRAMYDRLGFTGEHRFTSGSLQVRSRW